MKMTHLIIIGLALILLWMFWQITPNYDAYILNNKKGINYLRWVTLKILRRPVFVGNNKEPFEKAFATIPPNSIIFIGRGQYLIDSTLSPLNQIIIEGAGFKNTFLATG